ncbi:hypothetical protein KEM54_004808 [Ascosphaera aggregata]|nr:hypothetical protein KEM54_004808 [Ascosphaera aggregata]
MTLNDTALDESRDQTPKGALAAPQESCTDLSSEAINSSFAEKDIENHTGLEPDHCSRIHPLQWSRSRDRETITERSLHAVNDDALAEEQRDLELTESYLKGVHRPPEDEFLVFFDGEDDPLNPRSLPQWRKWACILTLAIGAGAVTCQSSIYTTTYDQIIPRFHASRELATLGLSSFIFGMGIGPLFLAPLSEFYGRRWVYIVSFAVFTIFLIPCAVAPNLATLIVCRLFSGLAGSAFLSVAGGSVGDLFSREQIGFPMMVYTASPFVGPELGPLLGGFINQYALWRWTFYVMLIWSGVALVAIVVFVPETYHPVLLKRKAQMKRQETQDDRWHATIETFGGTYGFSISEIGLGFLGLFVGMVSGVVTDPFWRRNFVRLVKNKEAEIDGPVEVYDPEWRLPPAILGAPAVTVGLFIFSWTMYSHVHWIGPIIGSGIFGFG